MINRQLLLNYQDAINKISKAAQDDIGKALKNLDVSDVAAARDAVIEIMNRYLGGYTDAVATLASAFYDACRESELGSGMSGGAFAESGRNPDATAGAVRAFMQVIVNGGSRDQLIGKCLERADYEIKVAANRAVIYCGERDSIG